MITTYWRQPDGQPWQPITRDEFTRATQEAGLRHGGYFYIAGIAYRLEHTHGQNLRPGRQGRPR